MKYLYQHLQESVNQSNIYLTDSERIDSVEDYADFLSELLAIVNITISDFHGYDGETRMIQFKIHTSEVSIFVKGNTDYIDQIPVVKALNKTLKDIGKTGQIYSFWSGDFGQEIGFFYIENFRIVESLCQIVAKNNNVGEIYGIKIAEVIKSEQSTRNNQSFQKTNSSKSVYKSKKSKFSKLDYIYLIAAFVSINLGVFVEILIPHTSLNFVTGVISGLMIVIGIYIINKRI